ncbi:MAG: cell division protein FtsL [Nitrospirae bacterium]|nr:cell division protein FtsL [Nitrospirota bacterium]
MRLWLATLIILMVFLYVWTHIDIINRGYEIEGLLARKKELEKANKVLTIEISSLTSLDRIEKRAKNELGLSKPEPGQVIIIKTNRSPKGGCIAC